MKNKFLNPSIKRTIFIIIVLCFPLIYAKFYDFSSSYLERYENLNNFLSYDYLIKLIVQCNIYAILAISVNIITGFCGQLTLGHAAFWAIGAYSSAIFAISYKLPFIINFIFAGFVSMAFGVLIGIPALRLSGDYLAITTMAFGEITRLVIMNLEITGGALGLKDIPEIGAWFSLTDPKSFYYLSIIILLLIYYLTLRVIKSKVGRTFIAIREDEIACMSLGINISRYKLAAFAMAAFYAGLAGSFYAHMEGYIHPDQFQFMDSVYILAMAVLGGLGSLKGSIIGAFIITFLKEILRDFQSWQMVIFGVVLIMIINFRPRGIMKKN